MSVEKFTDPVCGMDVDPAHAAGSSLFEGRTHYFCATQCKTKFDADPVRFSADDTSQSACCSSSREAEVSCCRG